MTKEERRTREQLGDPLIVSLHLTELMEKEQPALEVAKKELAELRATLRDPFPLAA